jgi:peptidoglycan/xylan/chitin deacetylase (PgdA/CDA1 family)
MLTITGTSQTNRYTNTKLKVELNSDPEYIARRDAVLKSLKGKPNGAFGEFVKGVGVRMDTKASEIALTFDACGGGNSSGYDSLLISFLQKQKIKATLFVTGKWIDSNPGTFLKLSKDTLFDIENHGLTHKPNSFSGESIYGIKGTSDPKEAYDEIEMNALKIFRLTGKKPSLYRSGTAFVDELSVEMAAKMGYSIVSYDVLSLDAMPSIPKDEIRNAVMKHIHPGAVVIMHFNHPERSNCKVLEQIIPGLKKQGYSFVLLKNRKLLQSEHGNKH